MAGLMAVGLFVAIGLALMAGFPVAFTLAGVALIFAVLGMATGTFDPVYLEAFPNRLYGIMTNETLIAVPIFVFMGVMLERSKLADQLLQSLAHLMRGTPGGLGLAVILVGAMMAASTGIVGATVVTMGLILFAHHAQQGIQSGSFHGHDLCGRNAGPDYPAFHRVGDVGGCTVQRIPAGPVTAG